MNNIYKQIRDYYGPESKEQRKFMARYERQQEVEEELFVRAPRTKEDKKREKRLKSRSGYVFFAFCFFLNWSEMFLFI